MNEKEGSTRTFVLRILVRVPDEAAFVERYHRLVRDDRIFILTKSKQPIGTALRFTMEIGEGKPVLRAAGTVVKVRADSGNSEKPPGLVLQFVPIDEKSRAVVRAMAERRERGSVPDPAIEPGAAVEATAVDATVPGPPPIPGDAPAELSIEATWAPRGEDVTGSFPITGGSAPAPRLAETWSGALQPPEGVAASGLSGAQADFFVDWSIEEPSVLAVLPVAPAPVMAAPPMVVAAEKSTNSKGWRMAAIVGPILGLAIGVPAGGILLGARLSGAPAPVAVVVPAVVAPKVEAPRVELPKRVEARKEELVKEAPKRVEEKVEAPPKVALKEEPKGAPEPAKGGEEPAAVERAGRRTAMLRVESAPAGGEVKVNGVSRGRAPVAVELPSGHRYDVEVAIDGHAPWRRRVNLKPPETAIRASFGRL